MTTATAAKAADKSPERSSVAAFYAGRSIFVTGGTGFLGKVLIEKLLRSCPDVRQIFLLMRPKKGLSVDERLRRTIEMPLFDKLREERPESLAKLIPVAGDVSVEGLGLGPLERRVLMERASIIFHVAANVRFDENLKKDVFSNTRSTRDICNLAMNMKNLVALVHVSSTYTQCDKPIVEERIYPLGIDWRQTIRMVETLDEHTLRIFSSKYIGPMPNTYTFSKRLAEEVMKDYSKELPCVIYRPSIVVSTVEDPVKGWVDNFNGPVGMMIGGGKGVLRVVLSDKKVACDFIPCDVTIKGILTACWKRGIETITKDPEAHVYNCSSYEIRRVRVGQVISMGLKAAEENPLHGNIWYPRVCVTTNRFLHYVLTLLLHLLPAMLIDQILKLADKKPMLVDVQKRVYSSVVQLRHFLHNEWNFRNAKMQNLLTKDVPAAEKEIFGYDYTKFDTEKYFKNCLVGAKRYLLHEDLSRTEENKRHYRRMQRIDNIFNVCVLVTFLWLLNRAGVFSYVLGQSRRVLDGSFLEE